MKYWLLLSLHTLCWAQSNWYTRTIAGGNNPGDGGRALGASIQFLQGVTADPSGNIYIADADDNRIRRIDSAGLITTVAGTGVAGFSGDGGPANQARINTPYGLAVTPLGDLIFADLGNARVRRINRNGQIETIAGGGTRELPAAGQFIPPRDVRLRAPRNVLADRSGSIFISDFAANQVLEIRSDGNMTAMPLTSLDLRAPAGLVMDANGELLVADSGNSRIRRLRRDGRLDIIQTTAVNPTGLARLPDGSILVTDLRGDFLWQLDLKGGAVRVPMGGRDVAVDAAGNILTAGGTSLRRMNPQGLIEILMSGAATRFRGDGGAALAARLNRPAGVVADSRGNIYFSDAENHRIRCIYPDGRIDTVAGNGEMGFRGDGGAARDATLYLPTSLAVDPFDNVYFVDLGNHRIRAFQPGGPIRTSAGTGRRTFSNDGLPAVDTDINTPGGIVVDRKGVLFFTEFGFPRIRRVGLDGRVTTVAGTGMTGSAVEGQDALAARFNSPDSLAFDADGNLYIADLMDSKVVMIDRGTSKLRVLASGINFPSGLAVTPGGTVYFSESKRHVVKQIDVGGNVSVIAGRNEVMGFNFDAGDADTVLLDTPYGLALATDGALLLADRMNNRVRRIEPPVTVQVSNLQAFRVVHGATFLEGPVAPGLLLSLLTSDLPDASLIEVTFDRVLAPLLFASKSQLNFQVPDRVAGRDSVVLELRAGGALLYKTTLAVQGAVPGFFEQGGLVVGQNEVLKAGDTVTLYATGEGLSRVVEGRKLPFLPVGVEIAGVPAEVLTAENTGLLQLTIRIPPGINLRGRVPITLRVGPFENPRTQRIAVE